MANFTIVRPVQGGNANVGTDGLVEVCIDDPNGSRFQIKILAYDSTTGVGGELGSTTVNHSPTIGQFSVCVPAGNVQATTGNNRTLRVDDLDEGVSDGHPFRAVAGSGTCSASAPEMLRESVRNKFCAEDQPIPVALSLKLGSKVAKGACNNIKELNRLTPLVHSREAKQAGRWFSPPIKLGDKGSPPAYWVLEKKDAKTWVLVLRREKTVIVTYVLKTKVAKDCKFPIKLERQGAGGRQFTKWPATVTIAPAV